MLAVHAGLAAYGGSPPALFRPGSFAWRNSLFVVCGHTSTPFAVTSRVWRADIQAFEEAPEGLWRPVNWTVPDDSVVNAAPTGMYGHTATMFATDDDDPDEVRRAKCSDYLPRSYLENTPYYTTEIVVIQKVVYPS